MFFFFQRLFVREDGNHRVNIIGITELVVRSVESLRAIIDEGLSRRHHGKSAFNSNSSRSHAVFQISLKSDDESEENFRSIHSSIFLLSLKDDFFS